MGAAPILHDNGDYRLNIEAGVGVDVLCFDAAVEAGHREARGGNPDAAASLFRRAVGWYSGDLYQGSQRDDTGKVRRLDKLAGSVHSVLSESDR